jgi:hypothetical protein
MLKAFKSNATLDAPMVMQGAPLTTHVTSPTSWLFSVIVIVVEIVPLIFAAWDVPAQTTSTKGMEVKNLNVFSLFIFFLLLR